MGNPGRLATPAAAAVAILAPMVLVMLTLPFVVNIPFMDEWEWTSLAYHARTGSLTLDLIFAPHNEHRNTVPNLIFVALDRFGGWNVGRESALSLALIVVSDVLLWRLVSRTMSGSRRYVTFALLSLLLCSFGQWENFALGYNIGWNICTLCVIATVGLLTSPTRTLRSVALAALAAAAATFSSGQGLLLWPCGLVALCLVAHRTAASVGIWCASAMLAVIVFEAGYHPGPLAVPPGAVPTSVAAFTLTFLGAALRNGSGWVQALILGTTMVLLFGAACWAGIVATPRRAHREACAAWVVFGAYALLGAGVTALARRAFGVDSALQSHYAAIALFLPLGTIGLVASAWPHLASRQRRPWLFAAAALIVLIAGVDVHGVVALQRYAADRRAEIAAIAKGDASVTVLAYPRAGELARMLQELREVHDGPYYR